MVTTLGVDGHIWRPSLKHRERAVRTMGDLARDQQGRSQVRPPDAVTGRSGTADATRLQEQGSEFTGTVEHAALDPFGGYTNAVRSTS